MGNKLPAFIGAIIGLAGVLLGLVEPSLGWWQVNFVLGPINEYLYINAFGYSSNTFNNSTELVSNLLLIGGLLYLAGTLLLLITTAANKKSGAILFAILMIIGLIIYCYGLYANEDYGNILSGLEFLSGNKYNIFFGEYHFFGTWTWRLGNGFFISIAGAVIGLIGAAMIDKR